jgi:hypothetical protein
MTRTFFLALLAAAAVSFSAGCSLTIGNTGKTFTVNGVGTGDTPADATKAAREDAEEQVRQMGYTEFELEPSGSTSSASTSGHSEVSMGFRVRGAVKRAGQSHKDHSHDDDFCTKCNHRKTCKCSEPPL